MSRAMLYACLYAGLTGVNIVLFVASTRQLLDAYAERRQVERIAVHLHNLYAPCK